MTAVAKGFLVRRLLKSHKVQGLVKTIKVRTSMLATLINQFFELALSLLNAKTYPKHLLAILLSIVRHALMTYLGLYYSLFDSFSSWFSMFVLGC